MPKLGEGRSPAPPVWITVRADSRGMRRVLTAFSGLPPGRLRSGVCLLCGYNWRNPAHAKVLNATSNVGGLLLLSSAAKVIQAGFVMLGLVSF